MALLDRITERAAWFGKIALLLFIVLCSPRAKAADPILLMDVQINGRAIGQIGEFTRRGGTLMIKRSELHDLGLRAPSSPHPSPDDLIALSTLSGLTWRIDETTQTIYLAVPDNQRLAKVLQVDERPPSDRHIESGTGTTLNYDWVNTLAGHQMSGNGAFDFRAFSPIGVASSGFLVHTGIGQNANASGVKSLVRLDTTYTFANPATLNRYSVGDFITGGLSWTRPIRLEGFQARSDFSIRPDLVTFPLPSVSGSAAVPSTVDILTNGDATLSRQIDPGPFQIPQLPVVTGAGNISLTVTNALGQQVTVNQPFYASSALLAPGLQAFSAQVGAVRQNWGSVSNDFGSFAATGTYRRGLTSTLTVEGSTEATPGVLMAGGGVVFNVHNQGVMNVDLAASDGSSGAGTLLAISAQRISRRFSIGGSAAVATRNFRDVAAVNNDPVPRKQLSGNVGLTLGRFGSVGAAYASIDQLLAATVPSSSASIPQQSNVLSATYTVQVRRLSIVASSFQNFSQSAGSGASIGMTLPLGRRSSVSIGFDSNSGDASVQAQQTPVRIGDWGYQAYASGGGSAHQFAQVQHKSAWGLLSAGIDQNSQQTSFVTESQGAISVVDGGLFASNTINDSFAVVDTDGLQHVRVFEENRDIGSTDSKGRLLVPDLRAFDLNHLSIEPTDVPLDTTTSVVAREVRPQDRSGIVVKFPVKVSHAALLRLVDVKGNAIPVGSAAILHQTGAVFPVGYDGEAYVDTLSPHNELAVELLNGDRCKVVFDYVPMPGEIPTLGPLSCKEQN